jgi:hypothetical protein
LAIEVVVRYDDGMPPSRPEDSLAPSQEEALVKVGQSEVDLGELVRVFPDPAEAFICSPIQLTVKQLATLYQRRLPPGDAQAIFDFVANLRSRADEERWVERRAMFQARRLSARRDAFMQAEAEVWAMFGLEFRATHLRSMMRRWEYLESYVSDLLAQCDRGEGAFTTTLRDACKELDAIEERIIAIMPDLGLTQRGEEVWTKRAGDRTQLVDRIGKRLGSMAAADRAGQVFEVLQGGAEDRDPSAADG